MITGRQNKKRKLSKGALLLLCGGATLMLFAANARAVSLKESSLVHGDKITLGDIFYDLPRDEDRVLGAAPKPGQEMTLNARTLLRIALATELSWRPASNTDKITLKRDATIIGKDQIEGELQQALIDQGVTGDFTISIAEQFQKIALPADQPAEFEISKMSVTDDNKKFDAVLKLPSAANPVQTLQISGQIQPVVEVPVLRANIQNGTIIGYEDLEMKKIRDIDFSADTISDPEKLVGMTARRMIPAGRPIKDVDIEAQQLIERGSLVVLSLNSGALSLTTEAKALENGAKGDVIRVLNTTSNQTLQATVVAENLVSVTAN